MGFEKDIEKGIESVGTSNEAAAIAVHNIEIPLAGVESHDGSMQREKLENSHGSRPHSLATTHTATSNSAEDQEAQLPVPIQETPDAVPVPRSERRGLLARFTIIDEVTEPKHYPRRTKWFIAFIVALLAVAAPLGSAILFPSLADISNNFNASQTITNLSVALYMLSLALFPLWWSSFSETLGRRTIYVVSFTLFVLWNILTAVSSNITMFIIMRVLAGGAAGSVQAVGAGTIADVWDTHERGRAMGIFYLGPLMGPLMAPIIGGALQTKWGWRSTGWFMVIYGVVALSLLILLLPETLKSRKSLDAQVNMRPALTRTSTRQSVQLKTKKTIKVLKRFFVEPLLVVRYLRFPAVALSVFYASITFSSLYVLQLSMQAAYEQAPYNFTSIEVGLTYLSTSTGYVIASLFGGKWTDRIMIREAKKAKRYGEDGKLIYRPEERMRENAWLAALIYPCALLWYGWTIDKKVFWLVPLIANFFFGLGSMLIFGMITTMLVEFMPKKASSGVALNNLCRNICSGTGAIVTQPLLDAIGDGYTFTALFIITILSSSVVYVMIHFGPRWRVTMDKALNS